MYRLRCWLIRCLGGSPPLRMLPRYEPVYMVELRELLRNRPAPEWRGER